MGYVPTEQLEISLNYEEIEEISCALSQAFKMYCKESSENIKQYETNVFENVDKQYIQDISDRCLFLQNKTRILARLMYKLSEAKEKNEKENFEQRENEEE